MLENVFEQVWIVYYELVDNGSVNVHAGKLVRVAFFYNFRHFREMRRYQLRIVFDNNFVVENDILQEKCVVDDVFQQWLELYVLLVFSFEVFAGPLNQHFNISIRHRTQFL